jgi:hypothetical protein
MSKKNASAPATTEKAPEVKAAKPVIDCKTLSIPADVNMKICKTCTIFTKGNKKSALKGHLLELTNPTKEMGDRVVLFTDAQIEKCHLGAMRGSISGIVDNDDLAKILTKYFKTGAAAAPKAKKAAKAKAITAPVVADSTPAPEVTPELQQAA